MDERHNAPPPATMHEVAADRRSDGAGPSYFQAVFESDRFPLWLLTPDGVVIDANGVALRRIGAERDAVVWRPFSETPWWHGEEARDRVREAVRVAREGGVARIAPKARRAPSEEAGTDDPGPLELAVRPTLDPQGQVTSLIVEGSDPAARIAAETRFERLAETLDDAVLILDADLIPRWTNAAARERLQLSLDDDASADLPLPRHAPVIDVHNQPVPGQDHPAARALAQGRPEPERLLGAVFETTTEWMHLSAEPMPGGEVLVRGRRATGGAAERAHEDNERRDDLTLLPNRGAFFERLARAATGEAPFGVLHVDVDDFRHINDRVGHRRADAFLQRFADALRRCLRPGDYVARLAGDEFAVLLPGLADESAAVKAAARILQQLRVPLALEDQAVGASASLGVALGRPGQDPELVARNADLALRHAKRSGRDRYAIYDETLSRERESEARMLIELKSALERDQLDVVYQPLVDAKDRRVIGAEALMRWHHPTLGSVEPSKFIPLAEHSGLILAMEQWLLEVALAQLKLWNQRRPGFRLSINVSARQLDQKGFFRNFETTLAKSGVAPENVQLEVTETYAMQRPNENGTLLRALADLGVTLAIDDFGTGYSNMGHLQHLPFGVIKIDRSFMHDVPADPKNFALVRTVIAMAQSLDLSIVAEGVETQAQADFLFWEGAGTLQGYLFGRPVDAAVFGKDHLD